MISRQVRNAALLGGPPGPAGNGPTPAETGQLRAYMDDPARRFLEKMAPYATDFFAVQAQGLDPDDFWVLGWYEIRAADTFPSASISENSRQADWKTVAFRRRDIDYIPTGAKLWFWKNCWLAYNPDNIGGAFSTSVVRRCNRVWTRYDYYGNVLQEPFVVERPSTRANANEYNIYEGLPDHYNNCVMQRNPETEGLRENDRLVMGQAVYAVRGLSDYILEFSQEENSPRLLYFSLYFQQPTQRDDLELGIADGKAFSWVISVDGPRELGEGRSARFTPSSLRCGQAPDREVSYRWESLSPELQVDGEGNVTGLFPGTGTIRCLLEQNPAVYSDVAVTVGAVGLAWGSAVPNRLSICQSVTLAVLSDRPVIWTVSGPEGLYSAEENGAELTLTGYYPCENPLVITVTDGENTLTATMKITSR